MSLYEPILKFEEKLRVENQAEFAEELRVASELFDLLLQAFQMLIPQEPQNDEHDPTYEVITRTFNDLHAGWKLIMEGMPNQGWVLFRDTIECADQIKLLEEDAEFRHEWLKGKDFFRRDILERMKDKRISPSPQNQLYKDLSQIYVHPSKKGTKSHVVEWYPTALEHRRLYLFGGVGGGKNIPRTRDNASRALLFILATTLFPWGEMFPVDKEAYPDWHTRFAKVSQDVLSLKGKADDEWLKYASQQISILQRVLHEQLR